MTYKEAAQLALDVQDASNLSGVVATYHEILMDVLWPEAIDRGQGTNWVSRHPVSYLFAYKVLALAGYEPLNQYEAYRENEKLCRDIVAGQGRAGLVDRGSRVR
jgi:hypothetical protein